MSRKLVVPLALVLIAVLAAVLYFGRGRESVYFTGFVEGEERVIRSEVTGRVKEVRFREGEPVPASAVVAVLDDRDVRARIESKQRGIAVLEKQLLTQEERVSVLEETLGREVSARRAAVREAETTAELARRTLAREKELAETGASTPQELDDVQARRDQAVSALERAREDLARARAETRNVDLARRELDTLRERRELALSELRELEVTREKFTIEAPDVPTLVEEQLIWPAELARPGTGIVSVLDPRDKYVRIYVPVPELHRVDVGTRVAIELDSEPGRRFAGEVSFIANQASFTPEKIETRSDRVGQVYRAKVRILEDVERFRPGTEGNVYVVGGDAP